MSTYIDMRIKTLHFYEIMKLILLELDIFIIWQSNVKFINTSLVLVCVNVFAWMVSKMNAYHILSLFSLLNKKDSVNSHK